MELCQHHVGKVDFEPTTEAATLTILSQVNLLSTLVENTYSVLKLEEHGYQI